MKGLWIFLAAGVALAQGTTDQDRFFDQFGRPVKVGELRYNYYPNGDGWDRVTLDSAGREIERVPYTDQPQAPEQPALLACAQIGSEWGYSSYGNYIGQGGMIVEDFNGNGTPEVILTGRSYISYQSYEFWHVIEYDGESHQQIHVGPYYNSTIVKMLKGSDANGKRLLVTVLASGTVIWTDPETYEELDQIQLTGVTHVKDLVLADLEGDGLAELVVSAGTDLRVYRGVAPFNLLRVHYDKGGYSVAVGNLDADPGLEIASEPSNGHGFVIDGVSGEIEWDYHDGFGVFLVAGDIDGDGRDELVGADQWYNSRAFDVDQKAVKWSQTQFYEVDALQLADIDDDGVAEILLGEGQWGDVYCIEGLTGRTRWSLQNPEYGVIRVEVGDVDGDHQLDVLWSPSNSYATVESLYFADVAQRTVQWTNHDFEGSFATIGAADLDGDQIPELFTATSDGVVMVFDGASKRLISERKMSNSYNYWQGGITLAIGDVDNDGGLEYVITSYDGSGGLLQVYDGKTHLLEWETSGYNMSVFKTISLANVDSDPQAEIIVGENANYSDVRFRVFDKVKAIEQNTSPLLAAYDGLKDLLVADLDGDGVQEIALATRSGTFIFDTTTYKQKILLQINAYALCMANTDGDQAQELLVGTGGGGVHIYDCSNFVLQGTVTIFDSYQPVRHLQLVDLDGDRLSEWVALSNNRLVIKDGATGELVWSPDNCEGQPYTVPEVVVANLDADPSMEVLVGMGPAVRQLETPYCDYSGFFQALPDWPNVGLLGLIRKTCQ